MDKNILLKLASVARELDGVGEFSSSDNIMKIMKRLAFDEDMGAAKEDQLGTMNRDQWVPANKGTEKPFEIRGRRLHYMWNRRTGEHAYLDLDTDIFLDEKEVRQIFGM